MKNQIFENLAKIAWLDENNFRTFLYGKTCQLKSKYSIVGGETMFNQ